MNADQIEAFARIARAVFYGLKLVGKHIQENNELLRKVHNLPKAEEIPEAWEEAYKEAETDLEDIFCPPPEDGEDEVEESDEEDEG